jgi:hypothetical protein
VPGRRVDLGFEGGTVVRLTAEQRAIDDLVAGLGNGGSGWRSLDSEEGTYWLNLAELVYVRLVPGEVPTRVGFGGT